MYFKKIDMNV